MKANVTHNLEALNEAIRLKQSLQKGLFSDALLKEGGKFAFALAQRLRGLSPAKGAVRAERLDALRSGEGVKIRKRVREAVLRKYGAHTDIVSRQTRFFSGKRSVASKGKKRLNLQALMVQRELNTRESGRGFLGQSARYPRILTKTSAAMSRFGPLLSKAGLQATDNVGILSFVWAGAAGELSGSAARGLSKPRARAEIASAADITRDDIMQYVRRKTG
jgi:hypothetical protein